MRYHPLSTAKKATIETHTNIYAAKTTGRNEQNKEAKKDRKEEEKKRRRGRERERFRLTGVPASP